MYDNRAPRENVNEAEVVLCCTNVWKIFQTGDSIVKAVQNVSMTVRRGELLCIRGPSGSGKTTLLNLLGALDLATKGEVVGLGLNYQDLGQYGLGQFRRKYLGFVFQELLLIPHLTALENVMIPCLFDRLSRQVLLATASSKLQEVDAAHRALHFPRQLSSGERQRVAIARALMRQPQIILADEPTANLDGANVEKVIKIFQQLCADGVTILVATHDDRIQQAAHRVVRITDGILK